VSHLAQTDHANAPDDEFGGSGRFTGTSGRNGHEFLTSRKAGDGQVSRLVLRPVELALDPGADVARALDLRQAFVENELGDAVAVVTSVSKMSVWLGNSMPLARWLGPT